MVERAVECQQPLKEEGENHPQTFWRERERRKLETGAVYSMCVENIPVPTHCSTPASVPHPLSDGSDQVRKAALQLHIPG